MQHIKFQLVTLMTLVGALIFCSIGKATTYLPQIEVSLKTGNQRSISRPSILIPLLQSDNSLLYGTAIGMFDSKDNKEFNIGNWLLVFLNPHINFLFKSEKIISHL